MIRECRGFYAFTGAKNGIPPKSFFPIPFNTPESGSNDLFGCISEILFASKYNAQISIKYFIDTAASNSKDI